MEVRLRHGQVVSAFILATLVLAHPRPIAKEIASPQYRTGVTVVPVALRALDSQGNPVVDLHVADFQVFENGVRQEVSQFSTRAYGATAGVDPRTFVFVLGFGSHESSGGLKALVDFIRTGLLPSDRVSVVAYLRASEPSLDHEAVVRLLERYRTRYRAIESKLQRDREQIRGPMLPLSGDTIASGDM